MSGRRYIVPCTEERYNEMLEILPPRMWVGKGFLVGEPNNHRLSMMAGLGWADTYAAFFRLNDKFYCSNGDMTVAEFNKVNHADILRGYVEFS